MWQRVFRPQAESCFLVALIAGAVPQHLGLDLLHWFSTRQVPVQENRGIGWVLDPVPQAARYTDAECHPLPRPIVARYTFPQRSEPFRTLKFFPSFNSAWRSPNSTGISEGYGNVR